MVFEMKISFHDKKGHNFHSATCATISILGRRQQRRGRVERREGSSAALLLVRIRLSCKFLSQIQDISGKIARAVLKMPKPPSPYTELPCEKTLVSG